MATQYTTAKQPYARNSGSGYEDLEAILSNLEDAALLKRLEAYRHVGRKGHPLRALWRAYLCQFLLKLPSTNALLRQLRGNPAFRIFCGFYVVPHRSAFSRFINRLALHGDMVEAIFAALTEQVKVFLPDLGAEVAVDSTTIRSHSRPNNKVLSDPEASWTAKNSPRAKKDGKEWYWGYKDHMVSDANHGLPLAHYVTTASYNDSPQLRSSMAHAENLYSWFKPKVVIADRGYDSTANHEYLWAKGIIAIINIRRKPYGKLYGGIYTKKGVPTCVGRVPMKYVRSDPAKGHLYRCAGCHLRGSRPGAFYCADEVWEDPTKNLRLQGAVRRDSKEWDVFYSKRQSIERLFKSLKESRGLGVHYLRGMPRIALLAALSVLTFQATVLVKLQQGRVQDMRWMVEREA